MTTEHETVSGIVNLNSLYDLIKSGRHAEALTRAAAVLADAPSQREALHVRAICERVFGRIQSALDSLDALALAHPRFGSGYQERGLCLLARRDLAGARSAFARAVTLNPALLASWDNLTALHRANGEPAPAEAAARAASEWRGFPEPVREACIYMGDGQDEKAEALLLAFIAREGRCAPALRALARLAQRRRHLGEAEALLTEAIGAAPDDDSNHLELVRLLLARQNYPSALARLDTLAKTQEVEFLRATALAGLGRQQEALALFDALLASSPQPHLRILRGHALRALGRPTEAIEAYRDVATGDALVGDAYWSLANLKTYRFSDADVVRMTRLRSLPNQRRLDRVQLGFALGKALEDRGDYRGAFASYERANAEQRAAGRYRPEIADEECSRAIKTFSRDFFAARGGYGVSERDPIFIVGLPRSGSTLVEQILSAHPEVDATQELNELPRLVADLNGAARSYPERLAALGKPEFARLGRRYLDEVSLYCNGRPRFIDKAPDNFWHVGLIKLVAPNARVIEVRRAPMACGFSNFRQYYPAGRQFSYRLEDIAHYLNVHSRLMAHWRETLPGFVLSLDYEDVVESFEASVRRLLQFCDLAFDPSCLDFHSNRRSIATPSSEQVRRPLFREGLESWRHFEPWLEPLRRALDSGAP